MDIVETYIVVEEHRMRAEAIPRGVVDCIGERMLA